MEEARRRTIATLLVTLALIAFATATVSLTNITEWSVMAKDAPIVKVAGADDATNYVNVTTTTANDGTNRTVISLIGFRGDPTKYTSVLKICNKDPSYSYNVKLIYRGTIYPSSWPTTVKYIKIFNSTTVATITGSTGTNTELLSFTLGSGQCSDDIGAEVLVTPDAPTGQELIKIEVDVVSTKA